MMRHVCIQLPVKATELRMLTMLTIVHIWWWWVLLLRQFAISYHGKQTGGGRRERRQKKRQENDGCMYVYVKRKVYVIEQLSNEVDDEDYEK